jgi:hypothetical protein
MTDDCFDCLDVTDMAGNAIKRANLKGKSAIIFDELNSADPSMFGGKESTETQANKINARRKIAKQNKRRDN